MAGDAHALWRPGCCGLSASSSRSPPGCRRCWRPRGVSENHGRGCCWSGWSVGGDHRLRGALAAGGAPPRHEGFHAHRRAGRLRRNACCLALKLLDRSAGDRRSVCDGCGAAAGAARDPHATERAWRARAPGTAGAIISGWRATWAAWWSHCSCKALVHHPLAGVSWRCAVALGRPFRSPRAELKWTGEAAPLSSPARRLSHASVVPTRCPPPRYGALDLLQREVGAAVAHHLLSQGASPMPRRPTRGRGDRHAAGESSSNCFHSSSTKAAPARAAQIGGQPAHPTRTGLSAPAQPWGQSSPITAQRLPVVIPPDGGVARCGAGAGRSVRRQAPSARSSTRITTFLS